MIVDIPVILTLQAFGIDWILSAAGFCRISSLKRQYRLNRSPIYDIWITLSRRRNIVVMRLSKYVGFLPLFVSICSRLTFVFQGDEYEGGD